MHRESHAGLNSHIYLMQTNLGTQKEQHCQVASMISLNKTVSNYMHTQKKK
jgi:hypothetical protein